MASSSWLLATADSLQKTPTAAEQAAAELAAEQRQRRDVVAEWRVATKERMHVIEFEHGTTSGKRVLWLDGKEILRREWMFKLVGDDVFELDDGVRCLIRVNPARGMKFTYALYVDGKPFEQYRERQARALITWEHCDAEDRHYRIVLEKDTLNIFLNGVLREEEGEFADDEEGGTDTLFVEDGHAFRVSARSGQNARDGLAYSAYVDDTAIDESVEK